MIRVMIVDDEPSARDRYSEYVSSSDGPFDVVAACGNAAEALTALRDSHPHILLTDIRMPGKSGLELVSAMRSAGWDGRAVVISGHDEFEYAREALRLGMTDYLLKPVFPNDIHDLLQRIVAEERFSECELRAKALRDVDFSGLPPFVQKAILFAETHFEKRISLAEAATEACVNPTYLSTAFTRYVGMSFTSLLHHLRVEAANDLLADPELTLAAVAERVGCSDASHLTRLFRKVSGVTPGRARRASKHLTQ